MIKRLRKEQNITQKELAQRCNMTQGFLSKVENYFYDITVSQIIIIARELRVNVIHVAGWFILKQLEEEAEEMEFPSDEDEDYKEEE